MVFVVLIFSRTCTNISSFFLQKAKKKPMTKLSPADLNIDITPHLKVLSVEDPPVREAGSKVENVDELISKLKEAGVV